MIEDRVEGVDEPGRERGGVGSILREGGRVAISFG